MAEEAFALSPISASAAVPTDADYHAIREAFMETARGRWFLNEYAKRNRNADTAMVLEAVARIEQNMAAAHQEAAAPQPSENLSEMVQAALDQVREAIRHEFSEPGFDPALMPWRKSARIIREIVWGLRESGSDPRICNILDGQARAIEAACDEFPLADIRDRVLAALDTAVLQDKGDAPAAPAEASGTNDTSILHSVAETTADATPAPAQAVEMQAVEMQPEAIQPGPVVPEAAMAETPVMETAAIDAAPAETAIVDTSAVEAPVMEAATVEVAETATAEMTVVNSAVTETEVALEAVAAGAPTEAPAPVTASSEADAAETAISVEDVAEPAPLPVAAAPETLQPAPTASAAPRSIMTASAAQPASQPMAEHVATEAPAELKSASHPDIETAPESTGAAATDDISSEIDLWADVAGEIAPLPPLDPVHEASLGASLIAQGVVARPSNARPDLLAPIRRMSHAERIAFFS